MRVTQSMLQNNMLRNIFKSQAQMDKYLEQINTGKKIRKPSDDPVIAMKGIGYRTEVTEVAQYKRNSGEVDRKSTRLNSSHVAISYAVFCLKKKNKTNKT